MQAATESKDSQANPLRARIDKLGVTVKVEVMKVYAVMFGYSGEGEDCNSLKLFYWEDDAKQYAKQYVYLGYDYWEVAERELE